MNTTISMNTIHPNDPKGEAGAKKTPLHLLPASALRPIAEALRYGAERYGLWNWRKTKVNATTYHGAILRHMALWGEGEDLDPESGLPHLAHAAASIMILLDAAKQGTLVDDRPESGDPTDRFELHRALHMEALKELEIHGLPDGLPPVPPVPEGYTRWEYRGTGWRHPKGMLAYWRSGYGNSWSTLVATAVGAPGHYLEAMK